MSVEGTKKLGINFGDNDFYYTCTAFLRVLLPDEIFTHHKAQHIKFTKAQIVELFNGMAPSLYLLKQNAWRYHPRNIAEYITITEDKVYLDEEVDKFIKSRQDNNGEFFAVDFTLGYIWAF